MPPDFADAKALRRVVLECAHMLSIPAELHHLTGEGGRLAGWLVITIHHVSFVVYISIKNIYPKCMRFVIEVYVVGSVGHCVQWDTVTEYHIVSVHRVMNIT